MKVSLITTTYNSAATLSDTIESILSQTYTDIEYWIIDGYSTDDTITIIKQYESKFHGRMHYLSEQDKGLYDAMNKGIARCTGDIIGILNSDDYFTSNDVIAEVVRTFSQGNFDAVYGDIHFVRSNRLDKTVRYYSSAMFHPFWLRFGFMPAHPSLYIRREIYEQVGPYSLDFHIAADFDMIIRLFQLPKFRAKYLKKDFVTMRIGGISTRNLSSYLTGIKEQVKVCKANGLYTNKFLVSLKYLRKIFQIKSL